MLSRIQLRQFLAVVDTGIFTRAAHLLNVTQPSFSAGIAQLERELGTRLFVRERRRIRLTEAGNALLPIARGIERDFHRAELRVGSVPVPARSLRLGLLDSIATSWIERAVSGYRGAEPLELSEGSERELQAALASGSLDLALTLIPRDTRGGGGGEPAKRCSRRHTSSRCRWPIRSPTSPGCGSRILPPRR